MREVNADTIGKRYRIELVCDGVPPNVGSEAAIHIKDEFGHRPWHENVQCVWNRVALILTVRTMTILMAGL
jgi:hypothetical protein